MTLAHKLLAEVIAVGMLAVGDSGWQPDSNADWDKTENREAAVLERGPRQMNQVALTFDSVEGAEGVMELLSRLEDRGVGATFFLDGRWVMAHPACAREIAARGHTIGNLSWGHKDLTYLEEWQIKQELLLADDRYVSWFGERYQPLFRAPFGALDERVLRIAYRLGFRTIGWTIEPQAGTGTASSIARQILDLEDHELRGAILRFPLGRAEVSAALPTIIHRLRERGFHFVTVSTWIRE